MDEKTFQTTMKRAKLMQQAYANEPPRTYFYEGFQRGLRKLYHGEKFGTDAEHKKWLSLSGDDIVDRQHRGIGYRIGLNYEDLPAETDAKSIRKILGWSVAQMAVFFGVSPRTVEGWEQGRAISAGPAAKIRELFDV